MRVAAADAVGARAPSAADSPETLRRRIEELEAELRQLISNAIG